MQDINTLRLLPKVEVSFQDDFSGTARQYTLTPWYIINKLKEAGHNPQIGDSVLLWEIDDDTKGNKNYICSVGKVTSVEGESVNLNYTGAGADKIALVDNVRVFIKLDGGTYFYLPIDSPAFT